MTAALAAALVLAAAPARAAQVKILAFDAAGRPLDQAGLLDRLRRADDVAHDPSRVPFWALASGSGETRERARLSQEGPILSAFWPGGAARLELVWPVAGGGFADVLADNGGPGFADGDAVFLNEEIAKTQYRLFRASWSRRTLDWKPPYRPSRRARRLAEKARTSMAAAAALGEAGARARAFDAALSALSLAWEKALAEHGAQIARDPAFAPSARLGLTLDAGLLKRLDELDALAAAAAGSGANWIRLVLRPNPADFAYAFPGSFADYDGIVAALRRRGLKIMLCPLDTAQWPSTLTPEAYAARVRNVVLRYKGQVDAWEVGAEINGDWLGGARRPLGLDRTFLICAAGADAAKAADPSAETVATLYAWEAAAPDAAHSLSGWLQTYVPRGFGRNLDVVGLALYPEDSPVGAAFERLFEETAAALPAQKLLLSSFGYVERDVVRGYWWLSPDDADAARKDLVALYAAASCAMTRSLGGGFWWQTLDQMLPPGRRPTELYKAQRRAFAGLRN